MDVRPEMEANVMKELVEHQERLIELLHTKARYQSNGIRTLEEVINIRRREIIELRNTVDKDQSELMSLRDTSSLQRREISMLQNSIENQRLELSSVPNTHNNLWQENNTLRVTVDNQRRELSLLLNTIDDNNAKIHSLQSQMTAALRENIKKQTTIRNLEFDNDTLDKMYKAMRSLHEGKIHRINEYETKISQQKETIDELEAKNNHLMKSNEQLTELLAQALSKIENQRSQKPDKRET